MKQHHCPTPPVECHWRRIFLRESRRYVCRFCTSHLDRVKKELLYRLHSNREEETPKPQTTTAQKDAQKGSNLLCNSYGLAGIVKRGETGATNSAMRSVYLVPQQTRLHMSNPVSNLVQAAGDTPTSPSFGWKRGQVLLQCSARALGRLQCARHWQVL